MGFAAFAPCTSGLCPAYSSRPMGWVLSVASGLTLTPRVHSAKAGFIELSSNCTGLSQLCFWCPLGPKVKRKIWVGTEIGCFRCAVWFPQSPKERIGLSYTMDPTKDLICRGNQKNGCEITSSVACNAILGRVQEVKQISFLRVIHMLSLKKWVLIFFSWVFQGNTQRKIETV